MVGGGWRWLEVVGGGRLEGQNFRGGKKTVFTVEKGRFGAKKHVAVKKNHNVPLAERLPSRLFVQKPQVQVWERDLFFIIFLLFISTKKSCVLFVLLGGVWPSGCLYLNLILILLKK